jgi:uncharacterized protein YchJ
MLLPLLCSPCCADEAHYHLHCQHHDRTHHSASDYRTRLSAFVANKAKILAHNKQASQQAAAAATGLAKVLSTLRAAVGLSAGKSEVVGRGDVTGHTLKLNQFADWSREEFDRVMLPRKWQQDHGYQVQTVGAPAAGRVPLSYCAL